MSTPENNRWPSSRRRSRRLPDWERRWHRERKRAEKNRATAREDILDWARSLSGHPDLQADLRAIHTVVCAAMDLGARLDVVEDGVAVLRDRYAPLWAEKQAVQPFPYGGMDMPLRKALMRGDWGAAVGELERILTSVAQEPKGARPRRPYVPVSVFPTPATLRPPETMSEEDRRASGVWSEIPSAPDDPFFASIDVVLHVGRLDPPEALHAAIDRVYSSQVEPHQIPVAARRAAGGTARDYARRMDFYILWRMHPTNKPNRPDLWDARLPDPDARGEVPDRLLSWTEFADLASQRGLFGEAGANPSKVGDFTRHAIEVLAPVPGTPATVADYCARARR